MALNPQGRTAEALYNFPERHEGDLSFARGDIIRVLRDNVDGNTEWWVGQHTRTGQEGLFPAKWVRLIDSAERNAPAPRIQRPAAAAAVAAPKAEYDRVKRLDVSVDKSPNEWEKHYSFNVRLELRGAGGTRQLKANRSTRDFRVLSETLNLVYKSGGNGNGSNPKFNLNIPEWADFFPLRAEQVKERGKVLKNFLLSSAAVSSDLVHYSIAYWLNPNTDFVISEAQKMKCQEKRRVAVRIYEAAADPDVFLARAKWDNITNDEADLRIKQGQIVAITSTSTDYNKWWEGQHVDGTKGLVPSTHVERISDSDFAKLYYDLKDRHYSEIKNLMDPPKKENARVVYLDDTGSSKAPQTNGNKGRLRKRIKKFRLCSPESFDKLATSGWTIEKDNKVYEPPMSAGRPKEGDLVTLSYSGYLWEPQRQELLEFDSSDGLFQSPDAPVSANADGPLEFTVGDESAIVGVEDAVQLMTVGTEFRLVLAPHKAYGEVGFEGKIPRNAYLVYDLKLDNIRKPQKTNLPLAVTRVAGAARGAVVDKHMSINITNFKGAESTRNLQAFGVKPSVPKSSNRPDYEENKGMMKLGDLQKLVRERRYQLYGVDPTRTEEYLTKEEFQKYFGMPLEVFQRLPNFRRQKKKKELQIF